MPRPLAKSVDINILGDQKVCSFNCVYCPLGPTTMTMNQIRRDYIYPTIEEIMQSTKQKLAGLEKSDFDHITLCGNGESLLHPQITEIITALVELRDLQAPHAKTAIFSNGAHIQSRKLIHALNRLDERLIKLDAGNAMTLKKINDPLIRISVDRLAQDIKKLADCTLQATFIQGAASNTTPEQIEDWLEVVGIIQPKKLHLLTPNHPLFRKDIQAVDEDTLETIASRVRRRLPSVDVSVLAG